jgi:hypothetical protein
VVTVVVPRLKKEGTLEWRVAGTGDVGDGQMVAVKAGDRTVLLARVDGNARIRRQCEKARAEAEGIDPGIKLTAKRLKEADDAAYQARMDAEDIFDEAERRLSTSMAREGSRRAMASWDLHEKAIRKAEAAARRSCAAT